MTAAASRRTAPAPGPAPRNQVGLSGRVPAEPEERVLPSGDRIVVLRVVVPRPPDPARAGRDGGRTPRRAVDTIDVVCWSACTRRSAGGLREGDWVEVEGALRRRFFAVGAGRQSRYEVEATALRRLARGVPRGT
ncbi:single-stranded DNA-binding protein [Intrasporangium sp.]|uniref:single-stranded DNA-binding protein n=1 Tax=Intrasporangium sp. TaxID=1925024 RepID=UPI0032221F90